MGGSWASWVRSFSLDETPSLVPRPIKKKKKKRRPGNKAKHCHDKMSPHTSNYGLPRYDVLYRMSSGLRLKLINYSNYVSRYQ